MFATTHEEIIQAIHNERGRLNAVLPYLSEEGRGRTTAMGDLTFYAAFAADEAELRESCQNFMKDMKTLYPDKSTDFYKGYSCGLRVVILACERSNEQGQDLERE